MAVAVDYSKPVSTANQEIAAAFNAGADARLKGFPVTSNPYCHRNDPEGRLLRAWRAGWLEAHNEYAKGVRGRWHVAPLPKVRLEVARAVH